MKAPKRRKSSKYSDPEHNRMFARRWTLPNGELPSVAEQRLAELRARHGNIATREMDSPKACTRRPKCPLP